MINNYIKIVITGGPSSGKTTVVNSIKERYCNKVHVVTETALLLARGGFPMVTPQEWTYDWQLNFQDAIYYTQIAVESATDQILFKNPDDITILIYDRGLLDGAAYLNGSIDEFVQRYNVDIDEVNSRYDTVIHFDSVANYGLDYFNKYCSSEKFHDFKQSLKYDALSSAVWSGHENMHLIKSKSISEKIDYVSDYIDTILINH